MTKLKISMAQLNQRVGDLENNFNKIKNAYEKAKNENADILITPELSLTGYPLEDLVLNEDFLFQTKYFIEKVKELSNKSETGILIGAPIEKEGTISNSALLFQNGELIKQVDKSHLPNNEVFDEKRYFTANKDDFESIDFKDFKLGVLICEDIWHEDVATNLKENGAELLISINASPYRKTVYEKRNEFTSNRIEETNLPIVYLNQVGAQDELVFDGGSFITNDAENKQMQMKFFEEEQQSLTAKKNENGKISFNQTEIQNEISQEESLWQAMCLGLKDYIQKSGFPEDSKVVFGLSGGLDSAIVAAIAADALGPERVECILMPSKYTADMSNSDAVELCETSDINYRVISIEDIVEDFGKVMQPSFEGTQPDVTEENIQARLRGMIIMSLSNKFGWMPLSTGNKSEMAVGYCTLYGDMCGGFNPIKDLYKTEAFKLCEWRNNNIPSNAKVQKLNVIPERIITRPPSAELAPDQVDTNSLPDYPILDGILEALLEENLPVEEIEYMGYERETILKVMKLLNRAEFKRRQAAPGIKLTDKALRSNDRRYPIVNGFDINLMQMQKREME